MAADRVAEGRNRTREILAFHAGGRYQAEGTGCARQTALDHRTELRGTEAGTRPGHYEGRGWRGFHHHATLCIAAYGFLVAERSRFSPSARAGNLRLLAPALPQGFRPRGSGPTRAA